VRTACRRRDAVQLRDNGIDRLRSLKALTAVGVLLEHKIVDLGQVGCAAWVRLDQEARCEGGTWVFGVSLSHAS
jgi:hypothetical protein